MSLEYIDQLISNAKIFQEQVEARKTEADTLRDTLEATQGQLRDALFKLGDQQKTSAVQGEQLAKKDAEISKLSVTILDSQQKLTAERRRTEALKGQRDDLQKKLDILVGLLNPAVADLYKKANKI